MAVLSPGLVLSVAARDFEPSRSAPTSPRGRVALLEDALCPGRSSFASAFAREAFDFQPKISTTAHRQTLAVGRPWPVSTYRAMPGTRACVEHDAGKTQSQARVAQGDRTCRRAYDPPDFSCLTGGCGATASGHQQAVCPRGDEVAAIPHRRPTGRTNGGRP
jgi:hypothetical protein